MYETLQLHFAGAIEIRVLITTSILNTKTPAMRDDAQRSRPQTAQGLTLSEVAVLRAFHSGIETRAAVNRYMPEALRPTQSARHVLGQLRERLIQLATSKRLQSLLPLLRRVGIDRSLSARSVQRAITTVHEAPDTSPQIGDRIELWFPRDICAPLLRAEIRTFAELTLAVPRLKVWWVGLPGIGKRSAATIERFFAAHPDLTAAALNLIPNVVSDVTPWERIIATPNRQRGRFRTRAGSSVLAASTDIEAIQAWLELQESIHTRRAYRKEVERLVLWAQLERAKPISSLSVEDATAFRAFLRHPSPRQRWVGASVPRTSPTWRPFTGDLSSASVSQGLNIVSSLFNWLVATHYLQANPFVGVRHRKRRGRGQVPSPQSKAFNESEWRQIRKVARRLEHFGWTAEAAHRLRFLLEFSRATGLRSAELAGARLRDIAEQGGGDVWLTVTGKGQKTDYVFLPPAALAALERYLTSRGIAFNRAQWRKGTFVVGRLERNEAGLSTARLWAVLNRFFRLAAAVIEPDDADLAERLQRTTPHWMRHSHATHALAKGASLSTLRDNLRHASIGTTSRYLAADDKRRAKELTQAFASRKNKGLTQTQQR